LAPYARSRATTSWGSRRPASRANVRFLAADLGPGGTRVNAISAGLSGRWRPRASGAFVACSPTSRRPRRCDAM
jgi:hypothetical protein